MKTEAKPRGRAWREWTGHYEITRVDAPFAVRPIPEKAIKLDETRRSVYTAVRKTPTVLLSVPKIEEHMGCRIEDDDDKERRAAYARQERITPEEAKRIFPWDRAADLFYLSRIIAGELTAYVRDPETGDILQLSPVGWSEQIEDLCFSPRDEEGCVAPHYESLIRGEYQPIFLWRHEFDEWFERTFGSKPGKRRGRKPGSGSWEHADEPLVEEMQRLIDSGSAKSAEDAARLVEDRAAGSGALVSKRTRLAKRYRKRFPERN
jgi:hypothetical protein